MNQLTNFTKNLGLFINRSYGLFELILELYIYFLNENV